MELSCITMTKYTLLTNPIRLYIFVTTHPYPFFRCVHSPLTAPLLCIGLRSLCYSLVLFIGLFRRALHYIRWFYSLAFSGRLFSYVHNTVLFVRPLHEFDILCLLYRGITA